MGLGGSSPARGRTKRGDFNFHAKIGAHVSWVKPKLLRDKDMMRISQRPTRRTAFVVDCAFCGVTAAEMVCLDSCADPYINLRLMLMVIVYTFSHYYLPRRWFELNSSQLLTHCGLTRVINIGSRYCSECWAAVHRRGKRQGHRFLIIATCVDCGGKQPASRTCGTCSASEGQVVSLCDVATGVSTSQVHLCRD